MRLAPNHPVDYSYHSSTKLELKNKNVKIAQLGSPKATSDEAKILGFEYQKRVYRRTQLGDLTSVAEKGIEKREAAKNNKTLAQVSAECLTEFNKTRAIGSSEITQFTIIRSQF